MPVFFCEICDYKFNFKCRLEAHFASVHEKKEKYSNASTVTKPSHQSL